MILITGATGLVGAHLLYRFRESAKNIKALYRNKSSIEKVRNVFSSYDKNDVHLIDDFNWTEGDILDLPRLEAIMEGVDTIYHCAASLDAGNFRDIKRVNVTGTANVINVAIAHRVSKICHVSSIAALGDPIGERLINEDDYFNLDKRNTDYAISKFGAEMAAWRAHQEGLEIIIINPGVILGEGVWDSGSGMIFSKSFKGIPFYTKGSSGFIDVRDVVEIMKRLTESDLSNERYILVSENRDFKGMFKDIAQTFGKKGPSILLPKWLLQVFSIITKPVEALGWNGRISLAEVESYTNRSQYDNQQVKKALDYNFIPLDKTIQRVCKFYLNRRDQS